MTKLNNLLKGKTVQLSPGEINYIVSNVPNLHSENYKKLEKAFKNNKGCRLCLQENELMGAGFGSMARKGAKAVKNNKQLSKLKDRAINQGLNYAVNQAGLDEDTGNMVKGFSKKVIDKNFDEFAGSGFKSMAKKGAKAVKNNKQLSKLKDRAINEGLNYAVSQSGLDEDTGALVKNLGKKVIDKNFDELAGSGFNKKFGRKILKTGAKALKVGNKISNAMGYDDLDDMAIDFATQQTLGRIDPTLGKIASNQLNRIADQQIEKHGGNINPYLPRGIKGGTFRGGNISSSKMVFNDLSNYVHPGSDSFNANVYNDSMFDRLRMYKEMISGLN